jgi:cysteinyl-tRNA synthetase
MSLSAIRERFNVETLDLHAGGIDLIFTHHEDEIAQSEAATGQPFVRHWLHGEFLNVRGTKMSKRFGNFLTARDLREQGVDAAALRLLFWQTHYRQSLDFNDAALDGAREGVRRLGEFRERLARIPEHGSNAAPLDARALEFETALRAALNDDLNAPRAVAALFDFVRAINRELDQAATTPDVRRTLAALDGAMAVLDVLPSARAAAPELATWVEEQIAAREKARKAKDFREADRIRGGLRDRGVELDDTPAGTKWRML